jgi:hypothetical protein
MQISISPTRITKQFLLDKLSEEEVMSFYLGIIPDRDLHINPLRTDKHPTASFYRSTSDELIFKDWSTNFHGNFIDIVMEKYRVSYGKAISIIAHDFNIQKKQHYETHEPAIEYNGSIIDNKIETQIQAEIQDFTAPQLQWWQDFGITLETLKKYQVFSVKSVFLNGHYLYSSSYKSPIYGYYFGKEKGRELWKMYFPIRKNYRFLLNTNKLQGAKQLPATGDILVVTKSLKDVLTLYELGVPAIAPQAESITLSTKQYMALAKRFKYIIVNGDWDKAGQKFMINSRNKYPCICLSFVDKKLYAKDISDYVKKKGMDKVKLLVDKLREEILNGEYDYQLKCQ